MPTLQPVRSSVPNFGTVPALLVSAYGINAPESWWVGLDRAAFYARARQEHDRMILSKFSRITDERIVGHLEIGR